MAHLRFILIVAPLIPHHLANRYWLHTALIALMIIWPTMWRSSDPRDREAIVERVIDMLLGCAIALLATAAAFPRAAVAKPDSSADVSRANSRRSSPSGAHASEHAGRCEFAAAQHCPPAYSVISDAPMTTRITIRRPDDWHLHVRDGEMLKAVLPYTARHFGRAILMPNLVPPIRTTQEGASPTANGSWRRCRRGRALRR